MATFSSTDELYGIFKPFFDSITQEGELRPKFVSANMSFKLNLTDPAAAFVIDCTQDPPLVKTHVEDDNADVELTMSADDGHKLWLGELNIPMALARRKVKVNGSMGKMMGLLPAIQPAFAKYKTFLDEQGRADLIR